MYDHGTVYEHPGLVGEAQHPDKLQGHWLLARAGKRVLRPGGVALTHRMLEALAIGRADRVVEFAPGMGATAKIVLGKHPSAYYAVEREPAAAELLRRRLGPAGAVIELGRAEETGFASASATVVYGEAMLSMQPHAQKGRIIAEARRLLAPGGRYGIHELSLTDSVPGEVRHQLRAALAKEIHAGVEPLTVEEWTRLLGSNGFRVSWTGAAPMHLLEPARVLRDEGILGVLRIAANLATQPHLRRRVCAMRRLFRQYGEYLGAVSFVATAV